MTSDGMPRTVTAPAVPEDAESDRSGAVEVLTGFCRLCRTAGIAVTGDRTRSFLAATALLGAADRSGVYWAGRATLCSTPEDFATYDRAFDAWFDTVRVGRGDARPATPRESNRAALDGRADSDTEREPLATRAAETEVLRHRDIADLDETERILLAGLFADLPVRSPMRRGHRRRPSYRGDLDHRRTLRQQLRRGGEVAEWKRHRRRPRPRRIVFLIDVSGSMEPYADALLRLAHRTTTALPGQVETFTIGTRLTRITPALATRHPDRALTLAAEAVPDWSGGTRLGETLQVFLNRWGRRGPVRQSVTVIASDGWERGDVSLLGEQARHLARLAHSVVWMNPHRGKAGYAPVQAGIAACLPSIDHLVAGHSLASFVELLEVLADA